jgi:hypothetical protein
MIRKRHRGALTADVLVSVAMTAMLLTSAGVAVNTACQSVNANESQLVVTRASQRLAHTLAATLRCASVCEIGTGADADSIKTGTILYVTAPGGNPTAYVYDPIHDQLLFDTQPPMPTVDIPDLNSLRARMAGNRPTVVVMADNVTDLTFRGKYENRPDMANPAVNVSTLVNVQISMETTQGEHVMRQCESVVPRRTNQQH